MGFGNPLLFTVGTSRMDQTSLILPNNREKRPVFLTRSSVPIRIQIDSSKMPAPVEGKFNDHYLYFTQYIWICKWIITF